MRFGVCCSLEQAPLVLAAGFDYVELPAGPLFGGVAEPDWSKFDGINVEVTNIFVSGDLKLVGPDRGDVKGYADRVLSRAAKVGVKVVVIGSGAARKSPAGFDLDTAEDQFYETAAWCEEIAKGYGIRIAPESLVPAETNVGNYLGPFAQMLRIKGVGYTADSYHVLNQPGSRADDPSYWTEEIPFAPDHVHFADRPRDWPKVDDVEIQGFVSRLKNLGYDSRVSLECRWVNFEEELPKALEELKQLF